MSTAGKAVIAIAAALVLYAFLRRGGGAGTVDNGPGNSQTALPPPPPRAEENTANLGDGDVTRKLAVINSIGSDAWGGYHWTTSLVPAGPTYPGFYRTADGGYINPDTGESYQPGTSPPAGRITYDTGLARPDLGWILSEPTIGYDRPDSGNPPPVIL